MGGKLRVCLCVCLCTDATRGDRGDNMSYNQGHGFATGGHKRGLSPGERPSPRPTLWAEQELWGLFSLLNAESMQRTGPLC
jgi:hypothetical protein